MTGLPTSVPKGWDDQGLRVDPKSPSPVFTRAVTGACPGLTTPTTRETEKGGVTRSAIYPRDVLGSSEDTRPVSGSVS